MNAALRPFVVVTFTALASLASLAAPATQAEKGAPTPTANVVQRVEITATSPALAAARVVLASRDVDAVYRMSTGDRMSVASVGDAVLMRFGRRTAKWLRHDGRGSFVSSNGALALQFELDAGGEPQVVRLSVPAGWL